MMQRIYGTAFWTKEELTGHLEWLEEVKKRDHRKLGTDLDLFSVHAEAGAGFVFWHPNLGTVRRELEQFWWDLHTRGGYKAGLHAACLAREPLRGLGPPRELRRDDVRAHGARRVPVSGQADELPGARR